MQKKQQRSLEKNGWAVGDAGDFLDLSPHEKLLIETKLELAAGLRQRRERLALSQVELAERLGSSQSRVAKMEAADRSVSRLVVSLAVLAWHLLGASRQDVARIITRGSGRQAA